MVRRYDPAIGGGLESREFGGLVGYDEYEKLQKECEALKVENERLISALEDAKQLNIRLGAVNFNMAMGNANYREIAARAVEQMAAEWKTNSYEAELIRATCASHANKIRNGEIEL